MANNRVTSQAAITEHPYPEISRRLKERQLVNINGSPFLLSLVNIRQIQPFEEARVSIRVVAESPTTGNQHTVVLTANASQLQADPDQFIERAIQAMRNTVAANCDSRPAQRDS